MGRKSNGRSRQPNFLKCGQKQRSYKPQNTNRRYRYVPNFILLFLEVVQREGAKYKERNVGVVSL